MKISGRGKGSADTTDSCRPAWRAIDGDLSTELVNGSFGRRYMHLPQICCN